MSYRLKLRQKELLKFCFSTQVSFAMYQIAEDAAEAGPRGKGKKRARSGMNIELPLSHIINMYNATIITIYCTLPFLILL